jgi:hypothetical protein
MMEASRLVTYLCPRLHRPNIDSNIHWKTDVGMDSLKPQQRAYIGPFGLLKTQTDERCACTANVQAVKRHNDQWRGPTSKGLSSKDVSNDAHPSFI